MLEQRSQFVELISSASKCYHAKNKKMLHEREICNQFLIKISSHARRSTSGIIEGTLEFFPEHGLVLDGTPCGTNLVCVNQTCVSIFPYIDTSKCPTNSANMECSGNGVSFTIIKWYLVPHTCFLIHSSVQIWINVIVTRNSWVFHVMRKCQLPQQSPHLARQWLMRGTKHLTVC